MSKINKEWHLANKMPKNPKPDERYKWHWEHAKHCQCRKIEGKLRAEMEENGYKF